MVAFIKYLLAVGGIKAYISCTLASRGGCVCCSGGCARNCACCADGIPNWGP